MVNPGVFTAETQRTQRGSDEESDFTCRVGVLAHHLPNRIGASISMIVTLNGGRVRPPYNTARQKAVS